MAILGRHQLITIEAGHGNSGEDDDGAEKRSESRLPTRIASRLRLSLDSSGAHDDAISDVTVMDISQRGMSAMASQHLAVGDLVTLEVPLVGWRDAEIMWIDGARAGCRFVTALTEEELRAAIEVSPFLQDSFPGLFVNHG